MAIKLTNSEDGRKATFNEINITPLTDIFLVLLIIMMVVAPILDQQGLKLTIPDYVEENAIQNKEQKILTVSISEDNKYFIDGEEISAENLKKALKTRKEEAKDGLMIQAKGDSSHSTVVKLMDEARNSGIESISIVEI